MNAPKPAGPDGKLGPHVLRAAIWLGFWVLLLGAALFGRSVQRASASGVLAVTASPGTLQATQTAQGDGAGDEVPEGELPVWALLLVFGVILLLAAIAWPYVLAREKLADFFPDKRKKRTIKRKFPRR